MSILCEKGPSGRMNRTGKQRMIRYLSILELNKVSVVYDNLITLIPTLGEQLRQRKPLAGHLIPIVGVHKLVIIDAVRGIALHTLDGGMAAVEGDDVVKEALAGRGEWEGLARVGGVIF